MGAGTDGVGVNPLPQSWPGVQKRLVGDLHRVGVSGDQALSDEGVQDGLDVTVTVAELQLASRHPSPGVGCVVGDVDETGEDPAREVLLSGGEVGVDFLRAGGDGALDAATRAVVRDC